MNFSNKAFKYYSQLLLKFNDNCLVRKHCKVNRCIQIRCVYGKHNPPPGVTPIEPKAIPYVSPGMEHDRGGKLLLVIPLITFGLGTWQIKRLKWKTDLIDTINERANMDPIPLPLDPEAVADQEFRRVTVTGRFDFDNEIYYGPKPCLIDGEPAPQVVHQSGKESYGFNLVTPLIVSGTGERILVNRGWVRTKLLEPEKRPWSRIEGEVTITGVLRATEPPNIVGPKKNQKFKIWHIRDIGDIAKNTNSLPIWIDATTDHSIPQLLYGGQTVMRLRNEHLSYIITWYSLTLATLYLWYARYLKK